MKHVLIAFGTRPEVIKLAPVIVALKNECRLTVLHTGQHKELVEPMLQLFGVEPDLDLEIMQPGQDLYDLTQNLLPKLRDALQKFSPDFVMIQGDTTTSYLTSLAAFYQKIPVLHVEAGLRSHNPYYPFPEEMNRKQITHLSRHHFAPTSLNRENLLHEGISKDDISITGNTVIDALQIIQKLPSYQKAAPSILEDIARDDKLLVLTAHRRENHGEPLVQVFEAVGKLLKSHQNLKVIFPVHPNPAVQNALEKAKIKDPRFYTTKPFDYLSFLHILTRANLILSDSGGIQEEATALGKPVLVLRGETERQELIQSGLGELVGTDKEKIVERALWHLTQSASEQINSTSIFGDGTAAEKIKDVILDQL